MLSMEKDRYHPETFWGAEGGTLSNYANMAGPSWGCTLSLCDQRCRATASVGTVGEPVRDCHRTAIRPMDSNVYNSGVTIHITGIKHLDVRDTKSLPGGCNMSCLTRLVFPITFLTDGSKGHSTD